MATGITTVTSKYQVTIPSHVRKALRIRKGEKVAFVPSKEGYVIRRASDLIEWLADTMEGIEETVAESRRGLPGR